MTSALAQLKARQSQVLSTYKEAVEAKPTGQKKDDRFWKPTFDKEKGGTATIRFLPAHIDETLPWVNIITHGFKGPTGKYYIENSRRTIDESDPVAKLNYALYNSGDPVNQEIAKTQKRKPRYIYNVYIVKDPGNPENEGKVFLYETGPFMHNILKEAMSPDPVLIDPDDEDTHGFDPFDFWGGANFVIRMIPKTLGKDIVPNYEKSSWAKKEPFLKGDEAKIEAVYNQVHKLQPFISADKFKPEAELAKHLLEVTGPVLGNGINVAKVLGLTSDVQSTTTPYQPPTTAPAETMSDADAELLASLGAT